jgi:hypothetical protein
MPLRAPAGDRRRRAAALRVRRRRLWATRSAPSCSGEVATRPGNRHDFFNALIWLAFPRSKAAINRRHHEAPGWRARPWQGGARRPARCADPVRRMRRGRRRHGSRTCGRRCAPIAGARFSSIGATNCCAARASSSSATPATTRWPHPSSASAARPVHRGRCGLAGLAGAAALAALDARLAARFDSGDFPARLAALAAAGNPGCHGGQRTAGLLRRHAPVPPAAYNAPGKFARQPLITKVVGGKSGPHRAGMPANGRAL